MSINEYFVLLCLAHEPCTVSGCTMEPNELQGPPKNLPRSINPISSIVNQTLV